MSALIRALLVIVLAATSAAAERVLLADADPELERAVRTALAPWKLEVVVDTSVRIDAPQSVADARFVVWREGGELVVYDRDSAEAQRRVAPEGALDPASAAAAALTVKTLMRLPPPDAVGEVPAEEPVDGVDGVDRAPPTPKASGTELRVQGALAGRVNGVALGGRASLALFVKPSRLPLRFGIAGELGNALDVKEPGFRGTWRDWSVIGLASWAIPVGTWEIEPHVGAGVLRSSLDGEEGMTEHHEREVLPIVRAGTFVRLRAGSISVGGTLCVDATLGTAAYTRMATGAQFFDVPPFALTVGVFVAADLGR